MDKLVVDKLLARFLAVKLEEGQFRYVGFHVIQDSKGIVLDQSLYVNKLESVSVAPRRAMQEQETLSSKEHTALREMVSHLNWAVQGSRPDMTFELSNKFKNGVVGDLVQATKSMRN